MDWLLFIIYLYSPCTVDSNRPCHSTLALAGPLFSNLWNPYPTFPANCLELKAVILALLVTVLRGYQFMISTDNITVVTYINKQGGTHSHTLFRLVVDLFLWLKTQNIAISARHIPGCLNVIADSLSQSIQPITKQSGLHTEIVTRIFGTWGTPTVGMFATVHKTHLPQFISQIQEPHALAIDALSQEWQGRSMYMYPLFPLLSKVIQKLRTTQDGEVAITTVVSTSTTSLCGPLSHSVMPGPTVTTRVSRAASHTIMEALRQHYQAAGCSGEVFRLTATFRRRPSTNRM